jgi:hypothetical protein
VEIIYIYIFVFTIYLPMLRSQDIVKSEICERGFCCSTFNIGTSINSNLKCDKPEKSPSPIKKKHLLSKIIVEEYVPMQNHPHIHCKILVSLNNSNCNFYFRRVIQEISF